MEEVRVISFQPKNYFTWHHVSARKVRTMKTKPLAFFVALFLSLTLLAGKTLAQAQGVPTMPKYFDPANPSQPQTPAADSGDAPNPTGMNLNFIGAAMFPQTADTFVPLQTDLLHALDPFQYILDDAIVLTRSDAVENGTEENTITLTLGQKADIRLHESWIMKDSPSGEGMEFKCNVMKSSFHDYWSYQQDNDHLRYLDGEDHWAPESFEARTRSESQVDQCFQAVELGPTTITFTREANSLLLTKGETLTFRFNVIEAPAAPVADESSSGNKGE